MSNNTSVSSMPELNTESTVDEDSLKEKELVLREKELALKEQEVKAKIELEKRGVWFSSPLLIGLASAIFGLIGTGIGASLQGYSNFQLERQKFDTNSQLERQKFEFTLIQKALDIKGKNEAAKQLIFLIDSGVIQSLDAEKIRKIANQPNLLPAPSGTLPRSMCIGMRDQWRMHMKNWNEDNGFVRAGMEEGNCGYWGISVP